MLMLYLSLRSTITSPPPLSPPLNGSPDPVPPRIVRIALLPKSATFLPLIGRACSSFLSKTIPSVATSLASAALSFSR